MPPLIAVEGFVLVGSPRDFALFSLGPMPPLIAVEGGLYRLVYQEIIALLSLGPNATLNRR